MLEHAKHTAIAQLSESGRLSNRLRPSFVLILLVVLAQGLIFAGAMHAGTGGRWILPLDDAYIHQQYAVEAARGHPFRYQDQASPSSGTTSLLYPFLLAVAWRLGFRGDRLSAFAFAFDALCLFVSALLMARVARRMHAEFDRGSGRIQPSWVGLLAALLLLTNGAILWGSFSGMEGALFTALLLAALDSYAGAKPRRAALFSGLLPLVRPEGVLPAGLLVLVLTVRARRQQEGSSSWSWWLLLSPVMGLVQPALNLTLTGSATANSMRAKSWLFNVPWWPLSIARSIATTLLSIWTTLFTGLTPESLHQLPHYLRLPPAQLLLYMPPLLSGVGAVHLLWRASREWRGQREGGATLLILWILVGLSATAVMGTAQWHFHRYQLPFFVLGLLAGALGLASLAERVGGEHRGRTLFIGFGLLALAASGWSLPGFVWRYQEATRTILRQQVRLGEWIKENLPTGATVGVHDVGAIAYYGWHRTYDLVGLTEPPETSLAWRNGAGCTFEIMERSAYRPDYFAIYDDVWSLPYFTGTDLFGTELLRVQAKDVAGVAAASDEQAVYAADWRLAGSGSSIYQQDMLTLTKGLRLTDSLDVADLVDERSHSYRCWQSRPKAAFPSEAFQLTYRLPPAQEVLDGGRLLTGGEAFDLRTVAGEPLLLVGRFLGQSPVFLTVKINGRALGEWAYPAVPGRWQERALPVPAGYVTGAMTHVEIAVQAQRPGLEFHRPFYYWCYQGELPEAGAEIATRLDRRVGDSIVLLGHAMNLKATPSGYELDLDLFWQATRPAPGDYKVFVHWSDEQDTILTQQDNRPGYDLQPTWLWRADETVVDHYTLALPLDPRPPRRTILYIGMYDPATGNRLPIVGGDAANRLELARLTLPS